MIAALLYALVSLAIVFVNKTVLTVFGFPSFNFLALMQYVGTISILLLQKYVGGRETLPPLSWGVVKGIFPLPLFFIANTVAGLGATKHLNMPMFVLLRRFSIVLTMLLEVLVLHQTVRPKVQIAVGLMVVGALVAAAGDLQWDTRGYWLILVNDVFTAGQGVFLRKKMDDLGKGRIPGVPELPANAVLFYNSLFSLPIALGIVLFVPGELHSVANFPLWGHVTFIVTFLSAIVLGFALNYSYYLCTKLNSALTTTVVGSMKNVVSSYLGMLIQDYRFSWLSFLGVNVSVVATLLYGHAELQKVQQVLRARRQAEELNALESDPPSPPVSQAPSQPQRSQRV